MTAHLSTLLNDYLENYSLARDLGPGTIKHYEMTVRALCRWHVRPVRLLDLSDKLVNEYLSHMKERGLTQATIRSQRVDLCALWRSAAEEGLVDTVPVRVRRVRVNPKIPTAWTLAEVNRLLQAAEKVEGFDSKTGLKLSLFWPAFVRVGYDTALRFSDLLAITKTQVSSKGDLTIPQQKTDREIVCRLRASTMQAIEATFPPERDLLLPWGKVRSQFWYAWRKLLTAAGLPTGRREGPQKLRRTSASHLEKVAPGTATAHLGHRSPAMAAKHYIDPAIAYGERPLPPEIG